MRHFRRVHDGLDVGPILAELDAAPDLWNQFGERTASPDGPMAGTGDIWLRYFPRASLTGPEAYLREGRCEFYPAWRRLPSIHPVVFSLMGMCKGVELGGCLISRIPPGGEVKPHVDGAAWSARYYDAKYYVPLRSNARAINACCDEEVNMRPSEIWTFNNLEPHAVYNLGQTDRVTLIVSMRSAGA